MSPLFPVRRAEAFATLVDEPLASGGERDVERFAELLGVVTDLRDIAPPPGPRPDFVADLRERLMAEADTVLVALPPADRAPLRPEDRLALAPATTRHRKLAVAVGAVAAIGATSSMAVAAQSALPGSSLYPVKQIIERAQVSLAGDDAAQGALLLANATDRLTETNALVDSGDDLQAVAETLTDFTSQAHEGADLLLADFEQSGRQASVEQVNQFTASAMLVLQSLDGLVPESADDELATAGQTLLEIDRDAREACPSCSGGGITEMPAFLLSADGAGFDDLLGDLRDRADSTRQDDRDRTRDGDGDDADDDATADPTLDPTLPPPTRSPDTSPTTPPTENPTSLPTNQPTRLPTALPTVLPTVLPTSLPTALPTSVTSTLPNPVDTVTDLLTSLPTLLPSLPSITLPTLLPVQGSTPSAELAPGSD